MSAAVPSIPTSGGPQRKKKARPKRKQTGGPKPKKKAGQRPAWLAPAIAGGGILVCLLAIGGYMLLGTGSETAPGGSRMFIRGLTVVGITFFVVVSGFSTLTGGFSLALALCLLNASRSTFGDFLTHFKSGLLYYAILWGLFGASLLLGILTAFIAPSLGAWVVGIGVLAVFVLSYRLLMDWYDWEHATVVLVFIVTNVIQALLGYGISVVRGFWST